MYVDELHKYQSIYLDTQDLSRMVITAELILLLLHVDLGPGHWVFKILKE